MYNNWETGKCERGPCIKDDPAHIALCKKIEESRQRMEEERHRYDRETAKEESHGNHWI